MSDDEVNLQFCWDCIDGYYIPDGDWWCVPRDEYTRASTHEERMIDLARRQLPYHRQIHGRIKFKKLPLIRRSTLNQYAQALDMISDERGYLLIIIHFDDVAAIRKEMNKLKYLIGIGDDYAAYYYHGGSIVGQAYARMCIELRSFVFFATRINKKLK